MEKTRRGFRISRDIFAIVGITLLVIYVISLFVPLIWAVITSLCQLCHGVYENEHHGQCSRRHCDRIYLSDVHERIDLCARLYLYGDHDARRHGLLCVTL